MGGIYNKMKKKNTGIKWIIAIIVIGVIAAVMIPRLGKAKDVAGDEIEVKTGNIKTYYSFSGSIEAKNRQIVFADQPIQISEFKVKAGDMVKKDDVLYKTNRGVNIKSEIDGEVLEIYVEEDEQIAPGTKIIEIVDYEDLQLKVKVDEYDLKSINIDQLADVTIHALNKDFEGKITDIAKEGIYVNGVTFFNTTISIVNEGDILVGMSAEAKVLNQTSDNAPILPMTAIKFKEDNTPYVNIKNDRILDEVELEIGITDGINAEIKSGLSVGDKIFVPKSNVVRFGPPEGMRSSNGVNQ